MQQRLATQRLPEKNDKQRKVARGRDKRQADAGGIRQFSTACRQNDQREKLQRVETEKMRHSNVAVLAAPAHAHDPGSAVRRSDGVSTNDRKAMRDTRFGKLRLRWCDHQTTRRGPQDGNHESES